MSLFEEDKNKEETAPSEKTYKYITPMVKVYRDMIRIHPGQYEYLEPLAADVIKAALQLMVRYHGVDGNLAREFERKYLGTLYGFTEERFVQGIGQEKFEEMEKEFFTLVKRKK